MPIEVYNHQEAELVSDSLLARLTQSTASAFSLALKNGVPKRGILTEGLEVEISIVDDARIAQVHEEFMGIPGATDVITFSHSESGVGEIVISAETAKNNGDEYEQTFEAELMLYIIHGLLHLAGHEDENPDDRKRMERIQFSILEKVWSD